MKPKLMYEATRAFLRGAPIGDVALIKIAALRATPAGLDEHLQHLRGFAPRLDREVLERLPDGSLGREYARFLAANGLEHLAISEPLLQRFAENPYAIRYTVTHDLHHLLTGFDTGLAGEIGVAAFTAAQGAGPIGVTAMRWLRWHYALLSPSQARAIFHNVALATEMGRKAKLVLAEPLESWLEEPIAAVRARLGILDADRAAIHPSGRSSLVGAIYDAAGRRASTRRVEPGARPANANR
jgi:ubiquinone biosynthesis protein Coq4